MKHPALLALLLAACGSGAGDDDGDDDVAPPDAASIDAEVDGGGPSLGWLEDYQREIIGKLAGAQEIAPGVTLAARSTQAQREATRVYITQELERWGLTVERYDYGDGENVLAVLPATAGGDDAMIVIGGHFDSVPDCPGAADDGTGVAVTLAAARYFSQVAERPHPMTFIGFDQEEIGLVGSRLWSDHLFQTDANILEVHSFDMISFDGDGDGGFELWSPSPTLEARYQTHAAAAGIPVATVPFGFSDHQSFVDNGFVVTGVGEEFDEGDSTPYYHTPQDTYDKIDFPYLASITSLSFAVIEDQ